MGNASLMDSTRTLLRFLLTEGLLKAEPSPTIFEQTPEGPLRVLARMQFIDERECIKRLSERLSIPIIDLTNPKVFQKFEIDKFESLVEPETCWSNKLIPLFEEEDEVVIAIANPLNMDAVKEAGFALGKRVKMLLADEASIVKLLNEHYAAPKVEFDNFDDIELSDSIEILGNPDKNQQITAHDAETPPIIKLCNKIISDAVSAEASDIHVEPTQSGVEVRFRIDGIMHSIFEIPKDCNLM
ncbi:MAG: hypothetical protein R3A13_09820 [Bdellovibrionota bacterium]